MRGCASFRGHERLMVPRCARYPRMAWIYGRCYRMVGHFNRYSRGRAFQSVCAWAGISIGARAGLRFNRRTGFCVDARHAWMRFVSRS
jgi:hypothetical protein